MNRDRFAWVVSAMAAGNAWFEKYGLELGTDAIVALLRDRIRQEMKARPNATMSERVARIAFVLRELADGMLKILEDTPEPSRRPPDQPETSGDG